MLIIYTIWRSERHWLKNYFNDVNAVVCPGGSPSRSILQQGVIKHDVLQDSFEDEEAQLCYESLLHLALLQNNMKVFTFYSCISMHLHFFASCTLVLLLVLQWYLILLYFIIENENVLQAAEILVTRFIAPQQMATRTIEQQSKNATGR